MAVTKKSNNTFIIIDNSYFNMFRFSATLKWYNFSPERKMAAEGIYWLKNEQFMATYNKKWAETITKLCKKFGVTTNEILFARDGHKAWRYNIYDGYKKNRSTVTGCHAPGPILKYTNDVLCPQVIKSPKVVKVDEAEGDDVIAVAVKYIKKTRKNAHIIIITGDYDILQLSEPGVVDIYTLKFSNITLDNPKRELMIKILSGDKSDDIPPAFPRCGKITAAKLADNPKELEKMLKKHGSEQYDLNRLLIDFEFIPDDIVELCNNELEKISLL